MAAKERKEHKEMEAYMVFNLPLRGFLCYSPPRR